MDEQIPAVVPRTVVQRLEYLEEQLMMMTQEVIRHQLTINHLTRGQTIMQKAKPGFEDHIIEVPVPCDAPVYKFVLARPEASPQPPSPILLNDGSAFRRKTNGSHQ